jgi:S-adenosylmethionine:tRNA-ribosyltransferase-isomerase (queuine synthetase)
MQVLRCWRKNSWHPVKTGEIKNMICYMKRGDVVLFNPVIKSMMHGKQEIENIKLRMNVD